MHVQGCAFCERARLEHVLFESDNFFLLADHAPLVEGHLLIIPRDHYACYGALPTELEDELLTLKRRVSSFLETAYRQPAYFEHGVFRQTVYHAHLHAFPFGPINIDVHTLAAPEGRHVKTLADVRAWYADRGQYFYLEQPANDGVPAEAAVFPPSEVVYFSVMGRLRAKTISQGSWQPPALRRMLGRSQVQALVDAWRKHAN